MKRVAESALAGSPGISLASDVVRLELSSNPGAFLSLGAGLPEAVRHAIFLGGVPVLLALLCVQLLRSATSRRQLIGVALLAGGGLGNWLDRMLNHGAVTDFVSIGLGGLRTGVFNLADVAVLLGIALLLLSRPQAQPATS